MIQIIGYDIEAEYECEEIKLSTIAEPKSLDEYEINIIDLRDSKIWRNNTLLNGNLNNLNDFHHLKSMINQRKFSKIIIIIPSNCDFIFKLINSQSQSIELKNMLQELRRYIFKELLQLKYVANLFYENTTTTINQNDVEASFYFGTNVDIITKSNKSEKATTIESENIIITSLNIPKTPDAIKEYAKFLGLLKFKQNVPDWFYEIDKFDDRKLKAEIIKIEEETTRFEEKRHSKQKKLHENNNHKSILYTNSDELVEETFKILEDMLKCDLSEFNDTKKEDFEIKKEDITFIGEIKGITSNVKNSNISQLDNHVQTYKDKLIDEEKGTKVKGLLIINALRTRSPETRDGVDQDQIDLAVRNKSLIITTIELLNLY